ncbi:MAG: PAS domain S-box protein, partial [bacterium]
VVESGQPASFSFGSLDSDADEHRFLSRLGHASALLVPFKVLGRSFGLLLLASDTHDLAESAWLGFARSLAAQFGQTVALGQSLTRLAASESRLRALMEQANDAILILDGPHRILEANQEAERLLGRPRSGIVGRSYDDFVVPEEREASARSKRGLADEGAIRVALRHFLRADGTRVAVEVSAALVHIGGAANEPVIVAILRDITERKRVEEELREAQRRLQHVVTSSPGVLYSLRPHGQHFVANWVSENVSRLLGYTAEEAMPPEWWPSHLHPDERDRVFAEMAALFERSNMSHEFRFRHKDGRYLWLRSELRLLRDEAGRPTEAVGSWSDVTARKEAEIRLQESEEQYRLLFDRNPHPMYLFDDETLAFLAVNDVAVHHYGYSRDELLGMTVRDIRPPEEIPPNMESALRAGTARVPGRTLGVFPHRKKDGTPIQMDVAANRIEFRGRKAWIVLAMDVTEKQSLEAQLRQAQKMEGVGRLAGGVAHDFNNLLGVITGYGELLQRRLPDDPRLKSYASDILKAAQRAAGLTRQL